MVHGDIDEVGDDEHGGDSSLRRRYRTNTCTGKISPRDSRVEREPAQPDI